MVSFYPDSLVPLETSVRPGSLSPPPVIVGQGDSSLQRSRGVHPTTIQSRPQPTDLLQSNADFGSVLAPVDRLTGFGTLESRFDWKNVHSQPFLVPMASTHMASKARLGTAVCPGSDDSGLQRPRETHSRASVRQESRESKRSVLSRSLSEHCLEDLVAAGLDVQLSDCGSDSCLPVPQGSHRIDAFEPFLFQMVPSRNRTLESVVYAGSGGANPFHPDFTEHRLHDFRELANASAPVGLQLLSIPADGNCMFASIKAALSNGLNRSPDAVMVFRQQCVDHLEQYTDLDPDHLQKLRLSGEWGDGYILQAAATLTRSRVQVWSPIWESCFRVVSEADLWDQDIFLAYNGTHYDAYVRKRRIRRKSPSYLYYGLADKLDVHAPTLSEAINADESVPAAPPNDLSLEDSNLNLENPLSGQAAVGAWESLPGDEEYGSWASHALHCGHLVVTTYNVTSFTTHEFFLKDLPGSLFSFQEVSCREDAALRLKSRLAQEGFSVALGPIPRAKIFNNRSSDTAAVGGLLTAARHGGVVDCGHGLPLGLQTPRAQVCKWLLQGVTVYIVNIWGFAGGSHQAESNNAALLHQVWEYVFSLGPVHILLLGDFNTNLMQSATFRAASHKGWVLANLHGFQQALPTVKVAIGVPHTVDWIVVSPIAAPALQSVIVWRGHCPTHAAVSASFSWKALTEEVYSLSHIRRPKLPPSVPSYVSSVQWHQPVSSILEWHQKAEQELSEIIRSSSLPWTRSMEGRGRRSLVLQPPVGVVLPSANRSSANMDGALPLEIRCIARQVRRLEKLLSVGFADMPQLSEAYRQFNTVWYHDLRFGIVRGSMKHVLNAPHGCVLQELLVKDWLRLYRAAFTSACDSLKRQRISAWKSSLIQADDSLSAKAYNWMSGPPQVWDGVVRLPSGPTHSRQSFFQSLADFWKRMWCKHDETHDWARALHMVQALSLPRIELPPLQAKDLRAALKRSSSRSASGVDGWSSQELLLLPTDAFQAFADLWTSLENSGRWEHDLLVWSVALPKQGASGSAAADFRLINILPRLFRLALSARARTILRLLLPHAPSWLVGSVPGRSATDIWLEVSCLINIGQRTNSPVSGVTMDLLKAFNTLPRAVGHALYSALGLAAFSVGYHKLLESFQRTFKVGQSVWPHTFTTSTGYLEGDPLSPLAMLLFTWAWGAQVAHVSRPLSYLDNWSLLFAVSDSIDFSVQQLDQDLKEALSATTDFCDICDLSISVKPAKTWMWSTNAEVRKLFRQGDFRLQTKPIPLSDTERDLGAHLVYTKAWNSRTTGARYAEATTTCHRLRVMPLPYALKVLAVKVKVFPQAHYAGEVSRPPLRTIETLRSAVTSALWAHERLFRSKAAVLNILRQVDPLREVYSRPLFALRKLPWDCQYP